MAKRAGFLAIHPEIPTQRQGIATEHAGVLALRLGIPAQHAGSPAVHSGISAQHTGMPTQHTGTSTQQNDDKASTSGKPNRSSGIPADARSQAKVDVHISAANLGKDLGRTTVLRTITNRLLPREPEEHIKLHS